MGVKGLWKLISPVGRTIDISSLRGKILAVDASIWLTQFLKAMRDDDGNLIPNAHIVGILRRICKLLFHRIRTIFVFDGGVPVLKKRTMERRRMKISMDVSRRQKAARGLLINQLTLESQQEKPKFIKQQDDEEKPKFIRKQDPIDSNSDTNFEKKNTEESTTDVSEDEWGYSESIHDIDVNTLKELPREKQLNILSRINQTREPRRREELLPVAGVPTLFSSAQLAGFLKDSKKKQELKTIQKTLGNQSEREGSRIVSDSTKEYILIVDDVNKNFVSKEEAKGSNISEMIDEELFSEEPETTKPTNLSPKKKSKVLNLEDEDDDVIVIESTEGEKNLKIEQLFEGLSGTVDKETCKALLISNDWQLEETLLNYVEENSKSQSMNEVGSQIIMKKEERYAIKQEEFNIKEAQLEQGGDNKILFKFKLSDITEDSLSLFTKEDLGIVNDDKKNASDEEDDEWESCDEIELSGQNSQNCKNKASTNDECEVNTSNQVSKANITPEMIPKKQEQLEDNLELKDNKRLETEEQIQPVIQINGNEDSVRIQSPKSSNITEIQQLSPVEVVDLITPQNKKKKKVVIEEQNQQLFETKLDSSLTDFQGASIISTEDALKRAREISSGFTSWAHDHIVKVTKGITEKTSSTNKSKESESEIINKPQVVEQEIPSTTTTTTMLTIPKLSEEKIEELKEEAKVLRREHKKASRDADTVTPEMREEVMELLELFGFPYIESPMEAEAQCAHLELCGIVEGVITDDCDAFLFGAKRVYKNIFTDKKNVEAYYYEDIEKQFGFQREHYCLLALLMGSDYTEGIKGIGIVNAMEVLNAFPGVSGLQDFRRWVNDEIPKSKKRMDDDEDDPKRLAFKKSHANVRRKWIVNDEFPEERILNAYLNPTVKDFSSEIRKNELVWNAPDVEGIRRFCKTRLGWDDKKINAEVVEPINAYTSKKAIQTSMDSFLIKYEDKTRFAAVKSKRMAQAVHGLRKQNLGEEDDSVLAVDEMGKVISIAERAKKKRKVTSTKKRKEVWTSSSSDDDV